MTRCWTFQEGELAQRLLVETGQGKFDPFEAFDCFANEFFVFTERIRKWDDEHQFTKEMLSYLYRLRPLKDTANEHRHIEYFVSLWNELAE